MSGSATIDDTNGQAAEQAEELFAGAIPSLQRLIELFARPLTSEADIQQNLSMARIHFGAVGDAITSVRSLLGG